MSSIAISGSGTRSLALTLNDQARTAAQMPTKPDDEIRIDVGGATARFVIPSTARLHRITNPDTHLVLEIEHGLQVRLSNPSGGHWPHVSVDARKEQPDHYADWPRTEIGPVADLLARPFLDDQEIESRGGSIERAALRYVKAKGTVYEQASLAILRDAIATHDE